jgi:hypothetical protein
MSETKKSRGVPQMSISEKEVRITGTAEDDVILQIRGRFDGEIVFGDLTVGAQGAAIDGQFSLRALTIEGADPRVVRRAPPRASARQGDGAGSVLPPFVSLNQRSPAEEQAGRPLEERPEKERETARFDFV